MSDDTTSAPSTDFGSGAGPNASPDASPDASPVGPSTGLAVLHLFCKPTPMFDPEAVVAATRQAESSGVQVITATMLGHKCDLAVMALHQNLRELRSLQTGLQHSGLDVVDSYVSITEISEYAKGLPEEMLRPRLYPVLPPEGKKAWCFYPMGKKREAHANWYALAFEERKELMHEHGISGRSFAGRIVQLITASAGLDEFEWGVTLFGVHADDLKDVVYTMRFDRASAVYADFGPFYTGMVTPVEEAVQSI